MNVFSRFSLSYFVMLLTALCMVGGAGTAFATDDPTGVQTTLLGCRNNGNIILPNGSGQFICPDAAYTGGNLSGWNELDLVPYRIILSAGNSAPATQTYAIAIAADNCIDKTGGSFICADANTGFPGYDVMSTPVLNTTLSSLSCTPLSSGGQQTLLPGVGGTTVSIYEVLTITQNQNTDCVYDYYERLALGSHLYSGASLHSNLLNQNFGTAGIGAGDVPIMVNGILPQGLAKNMSATQDSDYHWTVDKQPSAASVSFGDVCAANAPTQQPVTITITWTRLDVIYGQIVAVATITATNPASRAVTINLIDKIYEGTGQTTLLHTSTFDPQVIAANSTFIFTDTVDIPSGDGTPGSYLNDVASATYTDTVTGIPIPETTTAAAQIAIASGNVTNSAADVTDTESISGNALTFSVLTPSVGGFVGVPVGNPAYVAGQQTSGPVNWDSGLLSVSSSVDFSKTIYLPAKTLTNGSLTDTATLTTSGGITTGSGPLSVNISSRATTKLTITKTIPNPTLLDTGESFVITFSVTGVTDPTHNTRNVVFTFLAGYPTTQSIDVPGLVPDKYVVTETDNAWYPNGCAADSCSTHGLLSATPSDTTNVDLSATANGVVTCSGTATFQNVLAAGEFAHAAVQKVTFPSLASSDPDYNWTFKLTDPNGATLAQAVAGANGPQVLFGAGLGVDLALEGTYTVTETLKSPTWDLNSAVPNNGTTTTTCSFTIDYPQDAGKTKTCTFTNTKRGQAKVIKTVKGVAPTTTQTFTFQLRQGATSTTVGTILETEIANATNGGVIPFTTLLVPGNTYQICEIVMPGWLTSLGTFVPNSFMPPDGVAVNPNVDNSILCGNFTVQPGGLQTFTVDNTPPPGGRAVTIGFWKNWASCANSGGGQKPVLDQTMAKATPPGIQVDSFYLLGSTTTPNVAPDCSKAVSLLNKSTFSTCSGGSTKMSSDPLFNMAAQLVGAELNIAAGAGSCPKVTTAITQANGLLTKYSFNGCTHTKMTSADSTLANSLATELDNYNNDRAAACQ